MTSPWQVAPLATVRHIIADTITQLDTVAEQIGDVTLRPHQRTAADRLLAIIAKHGGAMLAEPVGLGKTYTALAVAAHHGGRLLIVAPASLREMWRDATRRADMEAVFTTYESLSRRTVPDILPDFIIADEAHRLRSANTRRYSIIAELARRARLLLVTATPVQNRRGDLSAQLALFLGRAAWEWSDERLTELVVRDSGSLLGARPKLDGPHRISLDVEDDCLDRLASLPSPIPARDESIPAALVTFGLLHQWTSSRAALVASLRRRRARGLALIAALETGRRPTRSELAAWTQAGDTMQLAFPEIVAPATALDLDVATLLASVERHNDAIDALIQHLRSTTDPDDGRAEVLLRMRRAHPGERIIAFCQYTETVAAMWSRLARERGVAALTATGARVAGGPIGRDEVIEQFTPQHTPSIRERDRIDLLITTDLLSEGLNLQEASVIVHLDLPWNPARLDQRVGRALRLESRHDTVHVYSIAPPAPAERLLHLEERLRSKLRVARQTVGITGSVLPSETRDPPSGNALAEQHGAFVAAIRSWRLVSMPPRTRDVCSVASVACDESGFLALVRSERGPLLLTDLGQGIDSHVAAVRTAVAITDSANECLVDEKRAGDVIQAIDRWLSTHRATATIDLGAITGGAARRGALVRVAKAIARAPRHQRPMIMPLAEAARAIASAPLSEGAERILETLVMSDLPDEEWLRSIVAFGEGNMRSAPAATSGAGIIAVILFRSS